MYYLKHKIDRWKLIGIPEEYNILPIRDSVRNPIECFVLLDRFLYNVVENSKLKIVSIIK